MRKSSRQITSIDLLVYFKSGEDYQGMIKGKVLIGMEMLGTETFYIFMCTPWSVLGRAVYQTREGFTGLQFKFAIITLSCTTKKI